MKKILFTAVLLLMTLSVNSQSLGWSPTEIERKLKNDGKYYEKGYNDDGNYYIYCHDNYGFHIKYVIRDGVCQLMTLIVFDEEVQEGFKKVLIRDGSYYTKGCYLLHAKESEMDMIWQPAPVSASAKSSGVVYMWWIFYKNSGYDDITDTINRY